jgi:hypothetical protein
VDACIESEEYPRLEMLRLSSCPSRLWKLVRLFSINIYTITGPYIFVTQSNTLQSQHSQFLIRKLHPSSTPECVSLNLLFWHSVQSLASQLHQPITEITEVKRSIHFKECYIKMGSQIMAIIKTILAHPLLQLPLLPPLHLQPQLVTETTEAR